MRIVLSVAAALLVIPACGASRAPDHPRDPAAAPPGVAARIAGTGAISEEEFKAMHELRDDAAPAARGETIDLAGTRAYLSLPKGATAPMPALVVIHEWWGLNDHIRHWTDRLAALGYAALAVDLYSDTVATDRDAAMAAMQAVEEAEARRVLAAALTFLAEDPRVQAPRRAVIGWCFGGGWSLQTAIDHPDLDAAVIYYGQLVTDPQVLGAIRAELLGIFANQDRGIPAEQVDAFERALRQAGVTATIHRYDAEHAFANPSGARYDARAAAAAWEELVGFLARTLGRS
jgi:carboxymethylenebutenolidase